MNRYVVWIFVIADLLVVVPRAILMFVDAHGVSLLQGFRPQMVGFTAIGTAILLSTGAAIIAHALFEELPAGSRVVLASTWVVAVLSLLGLLVPYLLADLESTHLSEVLAQRGWALKWSLLAVGAPVVEMLGVMGGYALSNQETESGFLDQLATNLEARALAATELKQATEQGATDWQVEPEDTEQNGSEKRYECDNEGCEASFPTKQGLGGHKRWCEHD